MPRCKAPEILRNEAYFAVRRNDEERGQRRRWAFLGNLLVEYRTSINDQGLAGHEVAFVRGKEQNRSD